MNRFTLNLLIAALASGWCAEAAYARSETPDTVMVKPVKNKSRLTLGGYGEAVASRHFYSDSYLRYINPEMYRNGTHGRFDLPHVTVCLGFDFGKGWSMGSEIEFEHGGTETATEFEFEEGGEYETETERGGEVALEQFWIQKTFMKELSIRAGMMVVPLGGTNNGHMPTEFFGVYRPEGENTLFPCTWHEIGLAVRGHAGDWKYEAMVMPGLDSERFGNSSWIHDGSASPYEFKIANTLAGAFRVDNFSVKGLRLSLSGYVGNSFRNTMANTDSPKNKGVHGTVTIGAFDFCYNDHNVIARGNFDYGHLSDSGHITDFNMHMTTKSPSKRQKIASDVICAGAEVGYNFFALNGRLTNMDQKFYVFGRYDYYDSMYRMQNNVKEDWCARQRWAAGFNYYPIPQVVVKGEYSIRILNSRYNDEPSVSLGVAYTGWFL